MKVLVTGSNGLIGKELVNQLLDKGYGVRGLDIQDGSVIEGIEYVQADIREFESVKKAVDGCDAIMHLAALPSPVFADCRTTFDINLMGTYNIYEAAEQLGIERVVQASSVNAAGMTWNTGDFFPDYFPIDENQQINTSCPYSLSKHLSEEIGRHYYRRCGISGTGLRFPGVYPTDFLGSEKHKQRAKQMRDYLDELDIMDEGKRNALIEKVRSKVIEFREKKHLEYATKKAEPTQEELGDIPKALWEQYMWFRYMLWTQVDVRDAARSFVLSLEADYEGFHPLYINDEVNFIDYSTMKLVELFYPDALCHIGKLKGDSTLISNQGAKDLIGYEPLYTVKGKLRD